MWKQMQNSLLCYDSFFSLLILNNLRLYHLGALWKNFCSSLISGDSCCKRELSSSKDINIYPNNMFAELFAFVSMSYLTNLSRGEPSGQVV